MTSEIFSLLRTINFYDIPNENYGFVHYPVNVVDCASTRLLSKQAGNYLYVYASYSEASVLRTFNPCFCRRKKSDLLPFLFIFDLDK